MQDTPTLPINATDRGPDIDGPRLIASTPIELEAEYASHRELVYDQCKQELEANYKL